MIGSRNRHSGFDSVCAIALVVAVLGGAPTNSADTGIHSGSPVNLDLMEADLQSVLAMFSQATEFVFVMDARTAESGALDRRVSASYDSTPWDRALDEILTEAGLTWKLEGKVLWIYLPVYPPAGERNFTGEPINLRLDDAKLADVLDTLSKVTGLEIDFDPELDTTVSVRLPGIPWDQVLDLVLRISGFDYTQENDIVTTSRISQAKGLQFGLTSHQ